MHLGHCFAFLHIWCHGLRNALPTPELSNSLHPPLCPLTASIVPSISSHWVWNALCEVRHLPWSSLFPVNLALSIIHLWSFLESLRVSWALIQNESDQGGGISSGCSLSLLCWVCQGIINNPLHHLDPSPCSLIISKTHHVTPWRCQLSPYAVLWSLMQMSFPSWSISEGCVTHEHLVKILCMMPAFKRKCMVVQIFIWQKYPTLPRMTNHWL